MHLSTLTNICAVKRKEKLNGKATTRKRATGWKFDWVRNGKIFARRSGTSAVVSLSSKDDLEKITEEAV